MNYSPLQILEKHFGYKSFRDGQEEIISEIINGSNVLTILPTGAGKSLCYQIPSILSKSFAIVISPLIALMKDQVDELNKSKIIAAFINSTISYHESENVFHSINNGEIKILFVSPEKLESIEFAQKIKNLKPEYLFIDEAHCISQWGHNFRPSYTKIHEFANFIEVKKISAFTATATSKVREDIIKQLNLSDPQIFVSGFERENLSLNVIVTKNKKEKVFEIITNNKSPIIIYSSTRKNAEELANFLILKKVDVQYYHAGLSSELRRIIQEDFISGKNEIIIATNAFGMGINKTNIRTIIHYNMPGTIENYYQEIGRAGRDSLESNTFLLYDTRDLEIQKYFIESSYPKKEQIEFLYNTIFDHAQIALGNMPENEIQLDEMLSVKLKLKNITGNILNAGLQLLESSGYLKINSNFNTKHFVKFLISSSDLKNYVKNIANNYNKEVILSLLRISGSSLFLNKTPIDLNKLSNISEIHLDKLVESLSILNTIGIISYQKPPLKNSIRILKPRLRVESLNIDFNSQLEKQNFEKEKLDSMLAFVFSENCRFNFILKYFGEDSNNYKCGKCDNCSGNSSTVISYEYIETILLEVLIKARNPIRISNLTKLLLGKSNSPSLKSDTNFGRLEHYKKEDIENSINILISKNLVIQSLDMLKLSEKGISIYNEEENIETNNSNKDYEKRLELFNSLNKIRKEASIKYSQNPNMICRDEIIREITKVKPNTASGLLSIEGFNQRMFNKIGEDFLSVLKEFNQKENLKNNIKNKDIPESIIKTLEYLKRGYKLSDITSLTKLPEAVISMQIETILEYYPETEIQLLIPKKEYDLIISEIKKGEKDLKKLKEILPNSISYGKIRIVLAKEK